MGIVTVHARTVFERPVLDVAAHQVFEVVTVDTELGVFRRSFEGIIVRWGVVACFAVAPDHGVVGAHLQKGGLLCTVGIVAHRARSLFDWILAMRLSEGSIPTLVARLAECGRRHGEEIPLRRGMGAVATRAPFVLQNLVPDGPAVILLLVALEADRIAFGTEEIGRIRRVWVVAGATRPLLQSSVHSRLVQLQILDRMAVVTECVAFLLEKELADDPVPKVTILALAIFDDSMNVLHRKILLDELLVAVQALLALELSLLGVGGYREERENDDAAKEGQSDSRCAGS
jgi:hypothetical protein